MFMGFFSENSQAADYKQQLYNHFSSSVATACLHLNN